MDCVRNARLFVSLAAGVAVCGLCVAARAAEPRSLGLNEAIEEALNHNLSLARGGMDVRRAALAVERADAGFDATAGPVLRMDSLAGDRQVTYGAEAAKPLRTGGTLSVSGTQSDRERAAADGQSYSALSVSISQPLFRRFGRAVAEESIRLASDQLRAEQRRWEAQKADLVLELVTLFEAMVRWDAQSAFEDVHLKRLDRLVAIVRARERQGRATRADVLRLELQRGETETRLTSVRERRSTGAQRLAELIGAPANTEFHLQSPPSLELELPATDAALKTAIQHRMDYAQVCDDADVAHRKSDLAQRNQMPDVNLTLSVRREAPDSFGGMLDEGENYSSLDARTSGFPWRRADRMGIVSAELQDASAVASVEIRRQSIAREVMQALAEIRRADAEKAIAERNRKFAADSVRVSRRLYDTGRVDDFALADAEQSLAAAENRGFEAASDALISRYKLLYTLGTLIEHPAPLRAPAEPGA